MPLPSSGLIDFSDVRAEMSQSAFTGYTFSYWASGYNSGCIGAGPNANYAPINLISSGSRYTVDAAYNTPISMSQWYSYNHTAAISASTTASLYPHWNSFFSPLGCHVSSMIPVDVGTSAATLSLNISGGILYDDNISQGCWMIFYGKPWNVDGSSNANVQGNCGGFVYSGGATLIASGSVSGSTTNQTITYNYTYDANKGQNIYYVISRRVLSCVCSPGGC
jgi:hypothetical protein